MRTKAIMAWLCLAGVTVFLVVGMMHQMPSWGITTADQASGKSEVQEAYDHLPLSFEANQGQVEAPVMFLSRGNGYSLFLTPVEAVLALRRSASPTSMTALRMQFVNGQATPDNMKGLETLPGKVNYFLGDDPARWQTNVSTYAKVKYEAVYPGVDLMYYGDQQQLEFDFVVAPGADPKIIALGFQGIDQLEVDAQADLVLQVAGEQIRMRKPLIYQDVGGMRREIPGGYIPLSPPAGGDALPQVGFQVEAYDPDRPLVIDPVLVYSTYLGGSGDDSSFDIAVDASGNAYVTGSTGSTDFPTSHPLSSTLSGGFDAFVAKLAFDPATASLALIYATYLGGSGSDSGNGIAVDADGAVYVTGSTNSTNFPLINPVQAANGGLNDAFTAKLSFDPTTATLALTYATYLGGSGNDFGEDIAIDAGGAAYLVGSTGSTDFPTAHPLQPALSGIFDAFAAKLAFDPGVSTLTLIYSTYLGGSGSDSGSGVAVDGSGSAYLTGSTASTDFPTANPAQPANGGSSDAFAVKLAFDPTLSALTLVYATYLGGSANDFGDGVALDAAGDAYLTGSTISTDFPVVNPFQPTSGGDFDAFAAKVAFNPATSALVLAYATYLGGDGAEAGRDIIVDAAGNAYLIGSTASTNFPTANPVQPLNGGARDAFVAKLVLDPAASTLTLAYATYLGGSNIDEGAGIAVDIGGDVYVTGRTLSSNFPTENPLPFISQQFDAFVVKIGELPDQPPTVDPGGPYVVDEGASVSVIASGDDPEGGALTFAWDFDGDGVFETPGPSATFSAAGLDGPSDHAIGARATDSSGLSTEAVTTVAVLNVAPTVGAIAAPNGPVTANADIATSADFTDPGLPDTHTAVWDWGDGSASAGVVHEADGSGSVDGSHAYVSPGLYTVKVTVTDDDGGAGEAVFQHIVVYDPSAGFVTGGGWIESPAGAYTPDPSLTGRLTFGFVAKYLNRAATPTGQATFKFHAAGLDFSSTSYEWLVIVGPKAQVKGSGAINGQGDYGFRLTVADGDASDGVDRLRLKIWDKVTGVTIYDNQMGAPDEADATQAIAGGNVTLHD